MTGYFSGKASFGMTSHTSRGSYDVFVMHVTASGAIDWAAQAGGTSFDRGYGVAHDGAGGALVTGYFSGEASFGSTSLTSLKGTLTCFVASLIPPPPLPPLLPRPPLAPMVPGGECNGDACDGSPSDLPPLPGGAPSPSRASPFYQPPASPFHQPPAVTVITVFEQPAVAIPALATSLALLLGIAGRSARPGAAAIPRAY